MGAFPDRIHIVGIDLAWGERRPDGCCVLAVDRCQAQVRALGLSQGDDELLAFLDATVGRGPAFLAVDAPMVCPNPTGARPVDRLTPRSFRPVQVGLSPRQPHPLSAAAAAGGQAGPQGIQNRHEGPASCGGSLSPPSDGAAVWAL